MTLLYYLRYIVCSLWCHYSLTITGFIVAFTSQVVLRAKVGLCMLGDYF